VTTGLFLMFVLLSSRVFWIHSEQPLKPKRLILIASVPLLTLFAFSFKSELLFIVFAFVSPPLIDALLNRRKAKNGPNMRRLLLLLFGSVLLLRGTTGDALVLASGLPGSLCGFPWKKLWLVMNAGILSVSEYNLIIRLVLSKLGTASELETPDQKELKAGRIIGALERLLILILFMGGNTGAVGLVITAKGLIRFPEINKSREFAEYFLVGTLLSVIGALATSAILMKLI